MTAYIIMYAFDSLKIKPPFYNLIVLFSYNIHRLIALVQNRFKPKIALNPSIILARIPMTEGTHYRRLSYAEYSVY